MPYKGYEQTCSYKSSKATSVHTTGHTTISRGSVSGMKNALNSHPVSASINANCTAFRSYSSGVITSRMCPTYSNYNHAIQLTGYGQYH